MPPGRSSRAWSDTCHPTRASARSVSLPSPDAPGARTLMLPKCLILVWRLGVLTVSIASSAARSYGTDPADMLVAEFPSYEAFEIATSSPPPEARPAIRLAQNTPDRNSVPAIIPNTANVSLQMAPGQSVSVGTKVSFRVTTRKAGYLLLVDIDPGG